ncbi:MAG: hydrogenase 3 maturation endopeptidase HyCI [Candidatus Aenigmarchaeota archaeon]|nr:hydrogenase 3 maturation endopeptidase HyCI [Candidatus Aenigmarchaeota archaeon]
MKTVVCGIGNRLRGDDAFGPLVVDALESQNKEILLLDCGSAPENFIGKVMQALPEQIILVDAFEMNQKPGVLREISDSEVNDTAYSTHNAPLSMFVKSLENIGSKITILGFQPKTTAFGSEISPETKNAVERAKTMIKKIIIQS